jgi:hypothetical protein
MSPIIWRLAGPGRWGWGFWQRPLTEGQLHYAAMDAYVLVRQRGAL